MALTNHILLGYLDDMLAMEGALEPDTPLFSNGMLDSVSMLNLIAFVEEKARILVRSEDVTLDNFDTSERIILYAQGRM